MTKAQKPVVEKDDYKIIVTLNGRSATYTNDDFAFCDGMENATTKRRREEYSYSIADELFRNGFPKNDARAIADVVARWAVR